MKVKKELKWSVLLIVILFPLLALVLMSNPNDDEKSKIVIEDASDSLNTQLQEDFEEESDNPVAMMIDGNYPQDYFKIPVDYDVYLSGTFGELRSNHFHGGIDIRTGGVEGKEVFASAEGYVSRINVSQWGYGNAVYVTHPNGYTTVYGHLQRFSKDIQFYVAKHQYANKKFEVELYPPKDLLQVEQGDLIAYSGNTGGSGGPHLHFEIRKTSTSEPLNPLLFGLPVIDNVAPEIMKMFIYQKDNDYRQLHGDLPFSSFNTRKGSNPSRKYTVNLPKGKYGIGAHLKDYFRMSSENLGVNYSKLYLNGELIFETKIEKINFSTTRYINSHMDFSIHKTQDNKIHKLFKDDGNRLPYYTSNSDNGFFNLDSNSVLKVVINDLSGGKDSFTLNIILDESAQFSSYFKNYEVSTESREFCKTFTPGNSFVLSHPKVRFSATSNALYYKYDICLNEMDAPIGSYSSLWEFGKMYVPMHVKANIAIKVEKEFEPKHQSKLLIVELFKGGKYAIGGNYKSGFIETSIKDLGTYYVAIDTVPPRISPIRVYVNKEFRFKLSDNLSGIKTFNAYVDNKWMLMNYEPKTGILTGNYEDDSVKGEHNFVLKVTDERGNLTTFERKFIIQ